VIASAFAALLVPLAATAQSYSNVVAHRYYVAHDWPSLARYAGAWTNAAPSSNDSWEWYALAEEEQKHYAAAIPLERKLTQLEPTWPAAWQHLSASLSYVGDDKGSIQALYDGIAHTGAHANSADWYNFANGLSRMNQTRQAIPVYQRALQLNPRNARAWNNLGTTYYELGMFSEAMQSYQRAVALGDPIARKNLTMLNADLQAYNARVPAANGNRESAYNAMMRQHNHDLLFYGRDMLPGDRNRG
jgi:tetratricopeptide (TPR) repeat protein